ncbi:Putative nagB/RpiA transferase, initiation factor 2B-like protein [Septoria linicola]|uniref:Translation initiation factor eIF2B subunit beta n=1 Tax=Septoria linicola TaxID=215465 RepID=A0A9Q9B0U9_9PEZI|nr:putative nagB/RpiA transferase, initiation factor 2B-like protein [Septoria linicola]USW58824.1 Putative nagB/RpiA transferase, initiation factor 2B-like protein [Septoria linicola]
MPSAIIGQTPSLSTFLKSQKSQDVDTSIELLVSLLKRRQIRNSRPCAIATAHLLLRVVGSSRWKDSLSLIKRICEVGRKLVSAQPREMAVGNIVRRVLGVVREVAEDDGDENASNDGIGSPALAERPYRPGLPTNISSFSPLHHGAALPQQSFGGVSSPVSPSLEASIESLPHRPQMPSSAASYAGQGPHAGSLFGLFQQPTGLSPMATPPIGSGAATPVAKSAKQDDKQKIDLRAEVCSGIDDLLEELDIVDTQIAESALDHIHSNEIILTHTSSQTVQKFLAAAAKKRKFTVVHAEAYPNDHHITHSTIVNGGTKQGTDEDEPDARWKPLTSMGIKVILIPDTAVFALMSRINKVIMAPHTVLANGSLIAAAGASTIALAAKAHRVPVVVLSGVYKLSPVYPFDTDELIEYGDPGKVVDYQEGEFMHKVDVVNPIFDHVSADCVDLYITNLGGHAPSFLYRIVADHYRVEDIDLSAKA